MSIPMDSVIFFWNLYTAPHNYDLEADLNLISEEALEVFQSSCAICLKEHRNNTGNFSTNCVQFVVINKMLQ